MDWILWSGGSNASAAGPLARAGQFFTRGGQPWTIIESSEFSLFKRAMMGEDIRPILDERASLGFNTLRVWLLNVSVVGAVYPGGIRPNQDPAFYTKLRAFVELCGSYGFVCELTAFTSTRDLMPVVADQHAHWQRTQDAVRGLPNVLLELVNEYNWGTGENAPDRSLWSMRPTGILASSGSSTADAPPPEPVWDYVLYHSNGLSEYQRKVGHNAMEWGDHYQLAAASNENTRFPDNDSSETHAYDAAAGGALLCAGSCFHSQGGKFSRPFDATERRCAAAWVAGARSVPLEFQRGVYHRHDERNSATVIRSYSRTLPDGRSHVVDIRA